ncbi:hypothetical protein ACFLWA_01610 [Chloroflexota bacterium]
MELAEILQGQDLPDWQVEALLDANAVELGFGSHYVAVPEPDSPEGYRGMERFISTVDAAELYLLCMHPHGMVIPWPATERYPSSVRRPVTDAMCDR